MTVPVTGGIANFPSLSVDAVGTGDTLQLASSPGSPVLTSVPTSSFSVTPAPASQIVVTGGPTPAAATAGGNISLSVTAEDPFGNVVTSYSSSVSVTLTNAAGAVLGGVTTATPVGGVAMFTGLTVSKVGSGYTFQASTLAPSGTLTAPSPAFSVSAGPATQLQVTMEPNHNVTVGSTFGLVVSAFDAFGNPVSSFGSNNETVTVALAANPGGATLGGTTTVNAMNGGATFSNLTLNKAGVGYTFVVTSAGLTGATTSTTDATAAGATQLAVTTQPTATITAGASFGFAVTVEDAGGNPVSNFVGSVNVALPSTAPAGAFLGGTTTATVVNGVANFSGLTLNKTAVGYTLLVSLTGMNTVATNPFTVAAGPVTQLQVTGEPPHSVAPGSTPPVGQFTVIISAEDANGNVNPTFTGNVTIAIQNNPFGPGAVLGGTLTVAAASGVATFSDLTLNKAANGYTLQATSGGFSATTSAINVSTSAATQLVVTTEPQSTVVAGQQFSLVVSAEDSHGNVDPSFDGVVTLNTPGGPVTATASSGVAMFSTLTLNTAGSGVVLQASANGQGLTGTATTPFQVVAAPATQLVFKTQPPSGVIAGNFFGLTVAAEDPFGNVDTNYSASSQIVLNIENGNGVTLSGPASVTIAAGLGVFTGLAIDTATPVGAGGYILQATSGSLSTGSSSPIVVTAAAAAQIAVTTQPQPSSAAGAVFTVVISAEDQFGNVDTSFNGNVTVALEMNGVASSVALGGTLTQAAANGVATFSDLAINTAASGYSIQATSGNLGNATTSAFAVTAGVATQLLLVTQPPTNITAGTPFSLVAETADSFGNVTSSYTQPVTLTLSGSATLHGTLSVTPQNGMATFSGLSLDLPGSGDVITVSSGTLTPIAANAMTVTVGAPQQLAVSSSSPPPSSVTAGSGFMFAVTAEDAGGNPTTSYNGMVTLSLANNPGGATLGGTLTAQAVNGVATFTNVTLDKAGMGYTLRATGTGLSGVATTGPITIVAGTATHLVLTPPPPGVVAAGATFSLTVSAEDANGNVDSTYSGSVTLHLNNPAGVNATLGGTLNLSASGGVATFSGLTLNKAASGYTIGVTSPNPSGTGNFAITTPAINVNPAPATQLVVTSQPAPNPVTAGSAFGLTVTAEDANGNVDPNFHGAISLTIQNNTTGATLSGTATVTPSAGVATFSNLSLDKATPTGGAGYTLVAAVGNLSVPTSPITVNAGAPVRLLVTAQPPTTATIGSGFVVQVTAVDSQGNVAPTFNGTVILNLQNNPTGATLGGTTSVLASSGVASFTGVTLSKIGSGETLVASSPSNPTLTTVVSNVFGITAAAATKLVVTAAPPATNTAGTAFNVTVQAQDNFGDVDPNFNSNVTLIVQGGSGSGSSADNITEIEAAVGGIASFTGLTLDKAATGLTIQLSGGSLPAATTAPFDVAAGAATKLEVSTSPPASVGSGQSFGLAIAAVDPFGNIDSTFSGSVGIGLGTNVPAGSALRGTTSEAAFSGVATFFGLSLNKASSGDVLQVSSNGLAGTTAGPVTVTPAAAARLVLTSAPPSGVTAGTPFGMTLVVEDASNNVDSAYNGNVTLSLANNPGGAGAALGGTVTVPVVAGTATFSDLTLDLAAAGYLIQASSGTLVPVTTPAISVAAAPATQLVITGAPPGNVNDGSAFGVTVTAEDRFGNVDSSFNGTVTLSLPPGSPGGASLGGTVTAQASGGVATFSGVTLNAAASGASLLATATGLSGTQTAAVTVIAPPAALQTATIQTQTVARHKTVKVIVLQFGGPVDPTAAQTPGNYALMTVANGRKHPSKHVALGQPVYNPATFQVTLRTTKPLNLSTPLHLAVNVTGQSFLVTLNKGGAGVSTAVAIHSQALHVEPVASHHTLDALLHAGFRPRYRHLSH
jgi:hypothetical protein